MYKLYYRFPTFLQQLSLLCLIVLSVVQFILLLAYIPSPLIQFAVDYEFLSLLSMMIVQRQDGIENIPLSKLWAHRAVGLPCTCFS